MKNTALNSAHDSRKLAALPAEKARDANSRGGSIGWRAAPLDDDERDQQRHPAGERADHLGAAPAGVVAAHQPPHDAERGAGDQHQARAVEPRPRP